MPEAKNPKVVIEAIKTYCEKVIEAHNMFKFSKNDFEKNSIYSSSIAFNVEQIGEMAKKLPATFEKEYPEIPWKLIKGIRDVIAHNYGGLDVDSLWETANTDIPVLLEFCNKYLKRFIKKNPCS